MTINYTLYGCGMYLICTTSFFYMNYALCGITYHVVYG